MKVSILVPVYGVEQYIERCACSLFEQTYEKIEYVFVDDCTPDHSIDILRNILNDYPNRIDSVKIVQHEKNRGSAAARNTAVDTATGDFVLWVDADDYVCTDLVEKVIEKQQETDAEIVCFDAKVLCSDGIKFFRNCDYPNSKSFVLKLLLDQAPHQLWGHLMRRSLYIDNKIQTVEGVNQSEDFYAMVRLAFFSKKVASLHEELYFYDMTRGDSYTNNFSVNSEKQIRCTFSLLYEFFNGKDHDYIDALKVSEINSISRRLRRLVTIQDDDRCYEWLQNRIKNIERKYWKQVKLYNRVVLYLKNKKLVALYSSSLYFAAKFIKCKFCGGH